MIGRYAHAIKRLLGLGQQEQQCVAVGPENGGNSFLLARWSPLQAAAAASAAAAATAVVAAAANTASAAAAAAASAAATAADADV